MLPSPAPTQDVEALGRPLEALKLVFAAEGLSDLLTETVKQSHGGAQYLDALLRHELEGQEERRTQPSLS